MTTINMRTVPTTPYGDQKPGTSGLRKTIEHIQSHPNYLENFIQAIFNAVKVLDNSSFVESGIVVGGDGRYLNRQTGQTILKMAMANGCKKLIVAKDFLMSTPAVSSVIRHFKACGGVVMTASHNPGGPHGDFGLKYNVSNGGAAPENVTNLIYSKSKEVTEYLIADIPDIDVSTVGVQTIGDVTVEVVDSTEIHVQLLDSIFQLDQLAPFVQRSDFSLVFDGLHGIAGPTARKIFVERLGLPESCLKNCTPLEDFGGGHPDPNLTYAHDLVEAMGLGDGDHKHSSDPVPEFGAACDGDADRNMILGKRFFVTPSDSLALICANISAAVPYYGSIKGVARSMPTSQAVDRVAHELGLNLFEVPTGWKFFGNLLDADLISICGEESFGTGSNHIREKDGIWAVLCWLKILAYFNRDSAVGQLVSVKDIVEQHWRRFGRNFYTRYDYEAVDSAAANNVFNHLSQNVLSGSNNDFVKSVVGERYAVDKTDVFCYTDPVDHSVSDNQGVRVIFTDGSRIVYRMSGTGSVGATIRVYIEQYTADAENITKDARDALSVLVDIALRLARMEELTGRTSPTVIT